MPVEIFFSVQDENFITAGDYESVHIESLQPCTHEEADTMILLHVAQYTKRGIKKVDSGVVIISVGHFHDLHFEELWISFGIGNHFCPISVHSFTVSSFLGNGKKSAWSAWTVCPAVTRAFTTLSLQPEDVDPQTMTELERFIIIIYSRVDEARNKLSTQGSATIEDILPTKAALFQHMKTAVYQAAPSCSLKSLDSSARVNCLSISSLSIRLVKVSSILFISLSVDREEVIYSKRFLFLDEAHEHDKYILDNEHRIMENPLAMYKLKRWLSDKWPSILEEMENSIIVYKRRVFLKLLNEYNQIIGELDINSVVKDIAELIYIYELPVHAVALGTFGPAQTEALRSEDIFQMRSYKEAKSIYEGILREDGNNRGATSNIKLIEQRLRNNSREEHVDKYGDYVKNIKKYCHDYIQPEYGTRNLRCREIGILNSSDTIRIYELHRNPDILLLYDVLNEHRRRVLIEKASDKLQIPDYGGELVFPDLKLRIKPVEGAAVFWQFRTRTTSVHRKLVRRIYCPVLTGSQWNAKFSLEHQDLLDWVIF
ncbi:hypothetical protein LSH36_282g03051 [Paralvinella palmiformis]|uniref:Prolyl 4-hydroxylase N-terminal domain-containing protein n=1 Tax=Paralvinella palmiformis TaxID=53620 RepID=A0AAD9JIZ2_9ANNE|nr:hypothetical protein LSH36_282g03051 [Paralvinella palmiformis]